MLSVNTRLDIIAQTQLLRSSFLLLLPLIEVGRAAEDMRQLQSRLG